MSDEAPIERKPRGSALVYAIAFLLVLGAGASLALALRDFLGETDLLWASVVLSAIAIVLAVLGVVIPRRP